MHTRECRITDGGDGGDEVVVCNGSVGNHGKIWLKKHIRRLNGGEQSNGSLGVVGGTEALTQHTTGCIGRAISCNSRSKRDIHESWESNTNLGGGIDCCGVGDASKRGPRKSGSDSHVAFKHILVVGHSHSMEALSQHLVDAGEVGHKLDTTSTDDWGPNGGTTPQRVVAERSAVDRRSFIVKLNQGVTTEPDCALPHCKMRCRTF